MASHPLPPATTAGGPQKLSLVFLRFSPLPCSFNGKSPSAASHSRRVSTQAFAIFHKFSDLLPTFFAIPLASHPLPPPATAAKCPRMLLVAFPAVFSSSPSGFRRFSCSPTGRSPSPAASHRRKVTAKAVSHCSKDFPMIFLQSQWHVTFCRQSPPQSACGRRWLILLKLFWLFLHVREVCAPTPWEVRHQFDV